VNYPNELKKLAAKHGTTVIAKAVKHFDPEEHAPAPRKRPTKGLKPAVDVDADIAKMSIQDMFNFLVSKLHFNPTEPNVEKIFGVNKVYRVVAPSYEPLKLLKSEDVESAAVGLFKSYFGDNYTDHAITIHAPGFIFIVTENATKSRELMINAFKPRYEMHLQSENESRPSAEAT
jgi:hypothetical protein